MIITKNKSSCRSVEIKDGVTIQVLEVVAFALFKVNEALRILIVINVSVVREIAYGLLMSFTWEPGDYIDCICIMRELESEILRGQVLKTRVLSQLEISNCFSVHIYI